MEQWKGKVAVVTGASAGIGEAICKDLCQHGVIVVGLARRLDRLEQLKQCIVKDNKMAVFHPVKCDLIEESDIQKAFEYVCKNLGGVDILVNNAGIVSFESFLDPDNLASLKRIIDTNLVGLVSCTKKAFQSMSDRDTPGYIINVSSVAGHSVPTMPGIKPMMNVYPSSKYALTALITVLRHELNYLKKNKIRVSNISPGAVRTEIFGAGGGSIEMLGNETPMLESKDVSNAILYMLGTNPRVQIEDVIIRPTGEMF